MTVDGHAHVFGPAHLHPRAVDALAPAEREAPVQRLLAAMDDAGVEQAVLVPLAGEDDVVGAARAAHPGRFATVAVAGDRELGRAAGVDPRAALTARLDATGAGALRTGWLGEPGRPLAESPSVPALRALAERGGVLWSYLGPDQAPLLAELPALVPGLRVVLNHLGFAPAAMTVDAHARPAFAVRLPPERVVAVAALAAHPEMHLMASGFYALSAGAPPYPDLAGPVRRLVDAFGPERTLWGSDFPWIEAVPGYRATLAVLDDLLPDLTAGERDAVRGGSASALLDLPPAV